MELLREYTEVSELQKFLASILRLQIEVYLEIRSLYTLYRKLHYIKIVVILFGRLQKVSTRSIISHIP